MNAKYSAIFPILVVATGLQAADFAIRSGTVVTNMPGQSVVLDGSPIIGHRDTDASPTLDIVAGDFSSPGDFYLQKGNGTKDAPQTSTLIVREDASLTVPNLSTGQNNENASHYSRSRLVVDGGTLTVGLSNNNNSGNVSHSENNGSAAIEVKNGGKFESWSQYKTKSGFAMGNNASADSTPTLDVLSRSSFSAHGMLIRQGATATVDNATIRIDRTMDGRYDQAMGAVHFNAATLTHFPQYTWNIAFGNLDNKAVEWLHGVDTYVGAGGLTMAVPGIARFEGKLAAEAGAENSASVTKTGSGILEADIFGSSVPYTISEGSVIAARAVPSWTDGISRTFNQTSDNIALKGHGALAQGTLHPAASGLTGRIDATAGNFVRDAWATLNWAQIYDDGTLLLTQIGGYHGGGAWMKNKVDVTKSFTLKYECSAVCVRTGATPNGGVLAVWQNDSRGLTAAGGGNNGDMGYFPRGSTPGVASSYAAGFTIGGKFVFASNGDTATKQNTTSAGFTCAQLATTPDNKLYVTVAYDADANTLTETVYLASVGAPVSTTVSSVNLQTATGASTAYFGFTGDSDENNPTQIFVENVSLVYDGESAPEGRVNLGGTLALDAGTEYTLKMQGASAQREASVGKLSYGADARLDIADNGLEYEYAAMQFPLKEAPSFNDLGDWDVAGSASVSDGAAVLNTSSDLGGLASKVGLPMGGNWKMSFDLDSSANLAQHYNKIFAYVALSDDDETYTVNKYTLKFDFIVKFINPSGATPSCQPICRFNNHDMDVISGTMFSSVSLYDSTPVHFDFSYDAATKHLTVTAKQGDTTETIIYNAGNNFAASNFTDGKARFMARTMFNANLIGISLSNFDFSTPEMEDAKLYRNVAVGFDSLVPATDGAQVVKGGAGNLVVSGEGSPEASVKIAEGGLVLRKTPVETVCADYGRGGWTFSDETGSWGASGGLKLNSQKPANANNAVTVNRVAVSGDWRASFKINLEGQNTPAGAISFFIQNADGGPHQLGGSNANAAWNGQKGIAVGWTVYPDASIYSRVDMANCRGFNYGSAESEYFGGSLNLPNATTDVTLEYNATLKTLAMTMSQGANVYKKTWENVDVATAVGGDLAYLGFGTGGGGAHARPEFVDFKFEQLSSVDPTAETSWLGAVELTATGSDVALDTSIADSRIRVGTMTVPAGVTLAPTSANARAVLDVDVLDAGSGEEVAIDTAGADVLIRSVASGVAKIVVSGGGKIILSAGDALADCAIQLADDVTSIYIEGRVKVLSVSVGDELQRNGRYSPGDAAWIAGPAGSVLKTKLPVLGLSVVIR